MTVRVSDERSSRIYKEKVQHNDCTDKKPKQFVFHALSPPSCRCLRERKEGLTAICNSVIVIISHFLEYCQFYRLSGRFLFYFPFFCTERVFAAVVFLRTKEKVLKFNDFSTILGADGGT